MGLDFPAVCRIPMNPPFMARSHRHVSLLDRHRRCRRTAYTPRQQSGTARGCLHAQSTTAVAQGPVGDAHSSRQRIASGRDRPRTDRPVDAATDAPLRNRAVGKRCARLSGKRSRDDRGQLEYACSYQSKSLVQVRKRRHARPCDSGPYTETFFARQTHQRCKLWTATRGRRLHHPARLTDIAGSAVNA